MAKTTRYMVPFGLSGMLLTASILSLWVESPALAEKSNKNPYQMGLEFYKNGDFVKARHYLEHVAKLKPTYFPVHYALGNTYMKMGDLEKAKASYMDCLNNTPDIATCLHIKTAMEYLNTAGAEKLKTPNAPNVASTPEIEAKVAKAEAEEKILAEAHEAKVKIATEKREKILDEAQKQVAAIKARYEEQYRWIDQNTNQWVINRETGEIRTGLDKHTHADLQAQCDEEVKRVLDIAESKARGIQIPTLPTMGGTSLHSSNVHSSSNAYVRHYIHPTKHKQSRKIAASSANTSK